MTFRPSSGSSSFLLAWTLIRNPSSGSMPQIPNLSFSSRRVGETVPPLPDTSSRASTTGVPKSSHSPSIPRFVNAASAGLSSPAPSAAPAAAMRNPSASWFGWTMSPQLSFTATTDSARSDVSPITMKMARLPFACASVSHRPSAEYRSADRGHGRRVVENRRLPHTRYP